MENGIIESAVDAVICAAISAAAAQIVDENANIDHSEAAEDGAEAVKAEIGLDENDNSKMKTVPASVAEEEGGGALSDASIATEVDPRDLKSSNSSEGSVEEQAEEDAGQLKGLLWGQQYSRLFPKAKLAPKKPLSGYVFFLMERRETLRETPPDVCLSFAELGVKLGAEWSRMSAEEKARSAQSSRMMGCT